MPVTEAAGPGDDAMAELKKAIPQLRTEIAAAADVAVDGGGEAGFAKLDRALEEVMAMPPLDQFAVVRDVTAARWEIEALKLLATPTPDARRVADQVSVQPPGVNERLAARLEQRLEAERGGLDEGAEEPLEDAAANEEEQLAAAVEELETEYERLKSRGDDAGRLARSMVVGQAAELRATLVLESIDLPGLDQRLKTLVDDATAAARAELESERLAYQRWALEQIKAYEAWHYDQALANVEKMLKGLESGRNVNWHPQGGHLLGPVEAGPNADEAPPEIMTQGNVFRVFPDVLDELARFAKVEVERPAAIPPHLQKQLYGAGWDHKEDLAHKVTAYAMVRHLLPINEALLDRPVLKLYDEYFEKGWQKLEGRDDQLWVAKEATRRSKLGLGDVP